MIDIVRRGAPIGSYWVPPGPRPFRGIGLHHSGGRGYVTPRLGGSWHYWVSREPAAGGLCVVYGAVDEAHCAHGIGQTDKWRPPWVPAAEAFPVSAINYVAIHIEIEYAPQLGDVPSAAQCRTVRAVLDDLYARRGPLPAVGHGQVDSGKWPTEPHWLTDHWEAVGLTRVDKHGRWLDGTAQGGDEVAVTPEQQAILDVMAGLNANAASIEGWINEIGVAWGYASALEGEVGALRGEVAALSEELARGAAFDPYEHRVELINTVSGDRHGYVAER